MRRPAPTRQPSTISVTRDLSPFDLRWLCELWDVGVYRCLGCELAVGMVHLFGWGQRPVNRYKAYDCFCRARSAGCSAAALNGAVCKWFGYGCKQNEENALSILNASAASASSLPLIRAIASVW
jgi:hypothetical protein